MTPRSDETQPEVPAFDFSAFPADTLFLDRRTLPGGRSFPTQTDARSTPSTPRPPRKERRRRVDPTTFEKQYNDEEIEFMNAIQSFKSRSGKMFPSHSDILKVALSLGYRKSIADDDEAVDLVAAAADSPVSVAL